MSLRFERLEVLVESTYDYDLEVDGSKVFTENAKSHKEMYVEKNVKFDVLLWSRLR